MSSPPASDYPDHTTVIGHNHLYRAAMMSWYNIEERYIPSFTLIPRSRKDQAEADAKQLAKDRGVEYREGLAD